MYVTIARQAPCSIEHVCLVLGRLNNVFFGDCVANKTRQEYNTAIGEPCTAYSCALYLIDFFLSKSPIPQLISMCRSIWRTCIHSANSDPTADPHGVNACRHEDSMMRRGVTLSPHHLGICEVALRGNLAPAYICPDTNLQNEYQDQLD